MTETHPSDGAIRLDTIDANSVLGFEADERRYDYAAAMLVNV